MLPRTMTQMKKPQNQSLQHELGKYVVFMALSNVSSVQGSSNKESKSDEDIAHDHFSNQEQDVEEDYMRLL